MSISRRLAKHHRGGFSLVEVLIAVLILAIGLLGLGAVIPVVVREQRLAADATMGISVANAARDIVRGPLSGNARSSAWDAWLDHTAWSSDYKWDEWSVRNEISPTVNIHPATPPLLLRETRRLQYGSELEIGTLYWLHEVTRQERPSAAAVWQLIPLPGFTFQLHVRDRLWPSPAIVGTGADSHRPQFVWDIVGRRVDPNVTDTQIAQDPYLDPVRRLLIEPEVQLAIFVRRIDPNIRVPSGQTLYGLLSNPQVHRRVPVAVDPVSGLPTLNGDGEYAAPLTLNVQSFTRDTLRLSGGTANQRQLASQISQRLVDNLGNIYIVREQLANGDLRITPEVSDGLLSGAAGRLNQVVFTPQVPATVRIVNIKRPVIKP